jgi:hypothetical protein
MIPAIYSFYSNQARLILSAIVILFLISYSLIHPQLKSHAKVSSSFNKVIIDSQGPDGVWLKTYGDIDGDGLLDLIAGGNNSGGLVWYQNPTWIKHIIDTGGGFSTDAEVVDIDGDGINDLVVLTNNDLRWYKNPGWEVHIIDTRVLHDVEVADFDGDGKVDVVARNQGEFGHRGDELHFYKQISPTSWQHRSIICPDGEGLIVEDIDRDGYIDVVINGSWFKNPGDILNGEWTEYSYTSSWTHPNAFVGTGDINGDGRIDIVLAPSELAGQRYRISWFEAPPDPRDSNWTEQIIEDNIEAVLHFVGTGDFDNDGDIDVAAAEMQQGKDPDEIKIYINEDGIGGSWSKLVIAATGSHSMRILDIDNDGDLDLFGANWQGNVVELYVNQSTIPLPSPSYEMYIPLLLKEFYSLVPHMILNLVIR